MAEDVSQQAELDLDAGDSGDATAGSREEVPTEPDAGDDAVDAPMDETWYGKFKDEKLKEHAARFTSPEEAIKANLNARSKLSKAIVIPGKDASEEEIADYRKKLGVPDKPDAYVFEGVTGNPEATADQKAAMEKWSGMFHKFNIPAEAAKSMVSEFSSEIKAAVESQKAADVEFAKRSEAELREEWKGDYDRNIKFANRAVRELMGDRYENAKKIEMRDGRFVMDHPEMVRVFAQIGREMGEGRLGGDVLNDNERQSLREKADEARSKANDAYKAGKHKEAQHWDKKEAEFLEQIVGRQGLVGTSGRNV